MFEKFNIEPDCPDCGSSEYFGDFKTRHHTKGKLVFLCETICEDCQFGKEYSRILQ